MKILWHCVFNSSKASHSYGADYGTKDSVLNCCYKDADKMSSFNLSYFFRSYVRSLPYFRIYFRFLFQILFQVLFLAQHGEGCSPDFRRATLFKYLSSLNLQLAIFLVILFLCYCFVKVVFTIIIRTQNFNRLTLHQSSDRFILNFYYWGHKQMQKQKQSILYCSLPKRYSFTPISCILNLSITTIINHQILF